MKNYKGKKVAVIGLGNIAERHRENLKKLFPKSYIYVLSASGRSIENFSLIKHADEVAENIDYIINQKVDWAILASPASVRKEFAEPLLKNKIPILLEKPVADNLADGVFIENIAHKYSTSVGVGYCCRFLTPAIKIKKLIDRDAIGRIFYGSFLVGSFMPRWRPRLDFRQSVSSKARLGGGALLELSHEIDLALWFFGKLQVDFAKLSSSKELNLEIEDTVNINASSNKGCNINIHLNFLQKVPSRFCYIVGTEGTISWDLLTNKAEIITDNEKKIVHDESNSDTNEMYLEMIRHFEAMINHKENRSISIHEGNNVLEFIECVRKINHN